MKKLKKLLVVDDRGRITLPQKIRKKADTFSVKENEDGSIILFPQASVSIKEAELIKNLKTSIQQVKNGEVEDLPEDWTL